MLGNILNVLKKQKVFKGTHMWKTTIMISKGCLLCLKAYEGKGERRCPPRILPAMTKAGGLCQNAQEGGKWAALREKGLGQGGRCCAPLRLSPGSLSKAQQRVSPCGSGLVAAPLTFHKSGLLAPRQSTRFFPTRRPSRVAGTQASKCTSIPQLFLV